MKQFILKNKKTLMGIGVVLLLGSITMSFQDSPILRQKFELQKSLEDTLPEKDNEGIIKMTNCDKLTLDLNKTLMEVGVEMKKIDFSFIQKEVENAINEIDLQKILKETQLSLKNIDLDKILTEVKSSLKDINWDEKNSEILKTINEAKKIENVSLEIRGIDRSVVDKVMEQCKEAIEKIKLTLKNVDIDKIMHETR